MWSLHTATLTNRMIPFRHLVSNHWCCSSLDILAFTFLILALDRTFRPRFIDINLMECFVIMIFAPSVSVQSLSRVWLFATPWTAAHQASLSITNSQSLPKLMSIELVMPSNHLILCHPLLFLPSIFPSIRVFSNESALRIRWTKYWSFSFSISPSNEHLRTDLL